MVHNMAPAYEASKYDIIWVSTSRIKGETSLRVSKWHENRSSNAVLLSSANTEILEDMVAKLQNPRVALVHQMPFTTDQSGLAAAVEKVSSSLSANTP